MLTLPKKPGSTVVIELVVPACLLLAIPGADHFLISGVTITPLANFLAMVALAIYLRPVIMVFWVCCYISSSIIMLRQPEFSQHGPLNIALNTDFRVMGAVAGGIVAMSLCITRAKFFNAQSQLLALFTLLPSPFVVSDGNGSVLFLSKEAERLLGISKEQATGQSYFTLLKISDQGSAIQDYLIALDLKLHQISTTKLKLQNHPGEFCDGIMIPVDTGRGRCLLTFIKAPSAQGSL